jgi:hypothetical protein
MAFKSSRVGWRSNRPRQPRQLGFEYAVTPVGYGNPLSPEEENLFTTA